jgi:hypothetical protein
MNTKRIYSVLAIIFLASLAATTFFHYFPAGAVGELAAIPAVGALFGGLFQLGRDSLAHERALRLEETKNSFTVGATSHMANVAFDKHVQFCEEYTAGLHGALETLFRRGPHRDVLQDAYTLANLRTKWAVWLTPEIESGLVKFEGALRTIGAQAGLLDALRVGDDRTDAIQQAYGTFAEVMGWGSFRSQAVTGDRAAEKVIEELRKVLGIKELTHLRTELVKRAFENLKGS